jgi:hypothetical protein
MAPRYHPLTAGEARGGSLSEPGARVAPSPGWIFRRRFPFRTAGLRGISIAASVAVCVTAGSGEATGGNIPPVAPVDSPPAITAGANVSADAFVSSSGNATPAQEPESGDPRGAASDVFGPEWIPPDSDLARDLRTLAIRGWLPPRVWTDRPLTRMDAARLLAAAGGPGRSSPVWTRTARELAGELQSLGFSPPRPEIPPLYEVPLRSGRIRIRPYAWFDGRWKDRQGPTWGNRPRVGVAGTAHLSRRLSLHEDLFAGRVQNGRTFADALIAGTDFLLFLESVYAGYEGPGFSARLGRMGHGWGPAGAGNLLLSGSAPPFDHLEYTLPLGRFRFQALTGVLSLPVEKNIAAHRLEFRAAPNLQLGVSEGAIFHGSPWQPLYVLGFVPYTLVERLQGQDVADRVRYLEVRNNVLWQFDLFWNTGRETAVWAAVLLDDIATETADMPSRMGFLVGAEAAPSRASGDWKFGCEAAKVYNYTYSVYYEESDWSHQDQPLGYPLGPDVESLRAYADWTPTSDWGGRATARWTRKGEGEIGVPWYPAIYPQAALNPGSKEYELSGVVENRIGVILELRHDPSAAVGGKVRLTLDSVKNRGHVRRGREGEALLELLLQVHR